MSPRSSTLAILGGRPAVHPRLRFQPGPRVSAAAERMVLASLRQARHGWGPNCEALQEEFARWNGNAHCAATNSGTAALHMAVAGCGVRAGDEVITTAFSWTSSATCILHHNAIPVFVDVDWDTMLIDPSLLEAAISPKTRAILVVHYLGLPCDMDRIMAIARARGLDVIEDACQAHGALYRGKRVGTFGRCAAFSLNEKKNLSGGEGGLFVTDDADCHRAARALMNFGEMHLPGPERDFHSYGMGWMYRTSDLPAAFARASLKQLDATNEQARRNWERLHQGLAGVAGLVQPHDSPAQRNNGQAYVFRVDPALVDRREELPTLRRAVAAAIKAEGVPLELPRWLLPAHTVFQARDGYGGGCPWTCGKARPGIQYSLDQYPVATKVADSVIQVAVAAHHAPNGARQVDAIVRGVRKVFENLDQLRAALRS